MRGLYTIMSKVPEQTLKESFNRFIKKTDRKKTKWVRILTFPTPNKAYGYRTRWYEHSADIDFEGITFRGIRDYDQYLSFKFGEYHKLPPEGQRKVHPVSDIRVLEKICKVRDAGRDGRWKKETTIRIRKKKRFGIILENLKIKRLSYMELDDLQQRYCHALRILKLLD